MCLLGQQSHPLPPFLILLCPVGGRSVPPLYSTIGGLRDFAYCKIQSFFWLHLRGSLGFPGGLAVKNPLAMQELQEMQVQSLDWEDPLEEGMATHSSILAWRIPRTEEPDGLQFMGSQRVTQD